MSNLSLKSVKILFAIAAVTVLVFPACASQSQPRVANAKTERVASMDNPKSIRAKSNDSIAKKMRRFLPLVSEKTPLASAPYFLKGRLEKSSDGADFVHVVVFDTPASKKVADLTYPAEKVSPKNLANEIRFEILKKESGAKDFLPVERSIYIDDNDAFGSALFARLKRNGWICVPAESLDKSSGNSSQKARYLAKLSGSLDSQNHAKSATIKIVDLKTRFTVFSATCHDISAQDFSIFLSKIFK